MAARSMPHAGSVVSPGCSGGSLTHCPGQALSRTVRMPMPMAYDAPGGGIRRYARPAVPLSGTRCVSTRGLIGLATSLHEGDKRPSSPRASASARAVPWSMLASPGSHALRCELQRSSTRPSYETRNTRHNTQAIPRGQSDMLRWAHARGTPRVPGRGN
eukprot:7101144-Prymnesium_polylepis.1